MVQSIKKIDSKGVPGSQGRGRMAVQTQNREKESVCVCVCIACDTGIFQAGRNTTVTQTIVLKPETRRTLDLDLEDPLVHRHVLVPLLGTTHECKNVRT